MADGLVINEGTGKTLLTDDCGGAGHAQGVKLAISADGVATFIPATVGNGLLVDVSRVVGNVTVVQSTATNLKVDASGVAVPVKNEAAGSLQVDAPVGTPVFVRLSNGSGAVDTIPISGTVTVQDAGGGPLTVDGTVATTQSGTHNIGTLTTITNAVTVVDGGIALKIQDGGNVITVDGTVVANQGTAAVIGNAWHTKVGDGTSSVGVSNVGGAFALKADVIQTVGLAGQQDKTTFTEGTTKAGVMAGVYNPTRAADLGDNDAGAIRLTAKGDVQASLVTSAGVETGILATPLRTDPIGTTTQPVLDTNSAAFKTALELLDDAIATIASAVPTKAQFVAGTDGTNARALKVNSSGNLEVALRDTTGAALSETNPVYVQPTILGKTPVRKVATFSASQSDIAVWTPTSGKKFIVEMILVSATAAGILRIFDNTNSAANTVFLATLSAGETVVFPLPNPHPSSTANNVLRYTTGSVVAGDFTVLGYESD